MCVSVSASTWPASPIRSISLYFIHVIAAPDWRPSREAMLSRPARGQPGGSGEGTTAACSAHPSPCKCLPLPLNNFPYGQNKPCYLLTPWASSSGWWCCLVGGKWWCSSGGGLADICTVPLLPSSSQSPSCPDQCPGSCKWPTLNLLWSFLTLHPSPSL